MKAKAQNLLSSFDCINEKGPVLVAVSGGSDSLALLFLAASWAAQNRRELHAVTVNHGLREEAESEAAFVSSICERLDVPHVVVFWEGEKPSSGIASAARDARYELMADYAQAIGARIIVTGHTGDDQAETIAMRLARADDNDGMAGMRGLSGMCGKVWLNQGISIFRPLIEVDRQTLRSYLAEISQSWIEDPTNFDSSYERVRVRRFLESRPAQKENLLRYGKVCAAMRVDMNSRAAVILHKNWARRQAYMFECHVKELDNTPNAVNILALQMVLAACGGARHFVSVKKADRVLYAARNGHTMRDTLGKCVVSCQGGILRVCRENRNLPSLDLPDGHGGWWDGRLWIGNDTGAKVHVKAMDRRMIAKIEETRAKRFIPLERHILATSPVIHDQKGGFYIPHHGIGAEGENPPLQLELRQGVLGLEQFCAQWDEPLAEWTRGLEFRTYVSQMPRNVRP